MISGKIKKGIITPAILIIGGAFMTIIIGILLVLGLQQQFANRQIGSEMAFNIAEAGVNYYRWHLAHDPYDFQDGTGGAGPYLHQYLDPQGNVVGQYNLSIGAPALGSSIVTITATGSASQFPNLKRTVSVQYGRPSFAIYSFLQNSSAWYGSGITVNGRIHSNNGIRMDGTNLSLVTSAVQTYTCGTETGCSPSQSKPGVWGSGGSQGLWQFPVSPVDFNSISFDFGIMKNDATSSGVYLPYSSASGYHLIFANNGTVQIKKVTGTNYVWGTDDTGVCQKLYQQITTETNVNTYNLTAAPIIYAEDNLWVEGTIQGRTTVVAARLPVGTYSSNIWIPNNLQYAAYDGTDSLGLIADNDIYFSRDIPNNYVVDGALMAQSGKIIRHGYYSGCGSAATSVRNSLTMHGAIISYLKSYWNYGSPPQSGFTSREIDYDNNLLYSPPPYFPTSGEYQFISWTEK